MDFQNRVGSKTGGGGQASYSESNRDRRERLAALAAETIDLAKDPYFMKNHLGTYECKLCLTLHNNEASYLAHTQGKKHQNNLARRQAKEAKDSPIQPAPENFCPFSFLYVYLLSVQKRTTSVLCLEKKETLLKSFQMKLHTKEVLLLHGMQRT